jgi:hypothetical protein
MEDVFGDEADDRRLKSVLRWQREPLSKSASLFLGLRPRGYYRLLVLKADVVVRPARCWIPARRRSKSW